MGYHGFTEKEKKVIHDRIPHEPVDYISMLLGCSSEKLKRYCTEHNLKKNPLGLRKQSVDYICYSTGLSEWQYWEIIERAAHEPLQFIANDMNVSRDVVSRLGIHVHKLPTEEQVYTKNYTLHLFKITPEQYSTILELAKSCTVDTIHEYTGITKKCITKVLYSNGIDEIREKDEVTPEYTVQSIPKESIDAILKYYPHFTNERLVSEFNVTKNQIRLVVKHYSLEKNPDNEKLCIICRINNRVGTEAYGSYCRRCFTDMMIEYQKEYYPNNKHRIRCRNDEVSEFEKIERNK